MTSTTNQNNSGSAARGGASRGSGSAGAVGQQFVSAVVHLAGGIDIETGHLAHYSTSHIQARIAGVLIYFLDPAAVTAFAAAVARTAEDAPTVFGHTHPVRLPAELSTTAQEVSLILRLQGDQVTERPSGSTAAVSGFGHGVIGCRVGGLLLQLHDAEALARLAHVARTVTRLAEALWPVDLDELEATDAHAAAWDRAHARR